MGGGRRRLGGVRGGLTCGAKQPNPQISRDRFPQFISLLQAERPADRTEQLCQWVIRNRPLDVVTCCPESLSVEVSPLACE